MSRVVPRGTAGKGSGVEGAAREVRVSLGQAGQAGLAALLLLSVPALAACANTAEPSPRSVQPTTRPRVQPINLPKVKPSARAVQPDNAGFEAGVSKGCPSGWTCEITGPTVARSVPAGAGKTGGRAVRVTLHGYGSSYTMQSTLMPAEPGRDYTVTARVRSSLADEKDERIEVRFLDKNKQLVGERVGEAPEHQPGQWYSLTASAFAPANAAYVRISLAVDGPKRTVVLDRARVTHRPRVEVWGGTRMTSGTRRDTVDMQLQTPTPGGLYVRSIDVFGRIYHVVGRDLLRTRDGKQLSYSVKGNAEFHAKTSSIRVLQGEPATISLTDGNLAPPPGTGFPKLVLVDPMAQDRYHVWVPIERGTQRPVLQMLVGMAYRDRVQQAVSELSAYLDARRTEDGAWLIAHANWPDYPRKDPMAIARIVQGYIFLSKISHRPAHEQRARDGLEWLLANQGEDGGFGLPWGFGSEHGHLGGQAHYPDGGRGHPSGHPYAISTAIVGMALLDGYQAFGDERYLEGAERVRSYLLEGPNGFQWLDKDHSRGSIPYCTLEPVLSEDDPRLDEHDVLPKVRNTAVEVYNIDGAALTFLSGLYEATHDDSIRRYGDALATNIAHQVRPDGGIPYAWYHDSYYSGGYSRIAFTGLHDWAETRGRQDWLQIAARGNSWLANESYAALLPTEGYATADGLGFSRDIGNYVERMLDDQQADGSFSRGRQTREDATNFAVLAELLGTLQR